MPRHQMLVQQNQIKRERFYHWVEPFSLLKSFFRAVRRSRWETADQNPTLPGRMRMPPLLNGFTLLLLSRRPYA